MGQDLSRSAVFYIPTEVKNESIKDGEAPGRFEGPIRIPKRASLTDNFVSLATTLFSIFLTL